LEQTLHLKTIILTITATVVATSVHNLKRVDVQRRLNCSELDQTAASSAASALASAAGSNDDDVYDRIASPTYITMSRSSGLSTVASSSQPSSTDNTTRRQATGQPTGGQACCFQQQQ